MTRVKRRSPGIFLTAVLSVAAAVLVSPGCSPERKPKNVILLTLDTLRADHVGAYHGGKAATPALDGLAARGILFENAWSHIPITLPSHASIFFGRPPHEVMNYNNGQPITARQDRPSFVEAFREKGFATAAFVSLGVLLPQFGLTGGFDDYRADFPSSRWYLTAGEVNRGVIPWLEAHWAKPFFLWVHYSDPHNPYCPPDMPDDLKLRLNGRVIGSFRLSDYEIKQVELDLEAGENTVVFETENPYQPNPTQYMARLDLIGFGPEAAMKGVFWKHAGRWYTLPGTDIRFFKNGASLMVRSPSARKVTMEFRGQLNLFKEDNRKLYRREVEYMDGRIGELFAALDRLGLRDETAVVAVADHGEGLGDYLLDGIPHFGHIHFLESDYLHVPLIVSVPGNRQDGSRRAEPVALTDIAPTLLHLMGLRGGEGLPGRDLLRLPAGAAAPVFMETYRPEAENDQFGLLDGRWHLIFRPEKGLRWMYDYVADPSEKTNLWGSGSFPAEIGRDLDRRLTAFARDILAGKKETPIDSKTEEMLKSLGYVGK